MDTLTALHTRRSIRAFVNDPVTREEIGILLDAAMIAPSAGNAQPWHFVVIDNKEILKVIPAIHPYAGMAPKAPVSILVCGDLQKEKYQGFWIQDCSAAILNILLAATALGIGTVWTGIYPVESRWKDFQRLFHLPDYIIPCGMVVVGRHAETPEYKSRFDAAKVSYNSWGAPYS